MESGDHLDADPFTLRNQMMQTEIVASRRKTALFFLGSLGFAWLAFSLPDQADHSPRWIGVFCVLCAIVFATLFFRPQRLSLDQDGFTLSGGLLRSPAKIAWRDVSGFFVVRLGRGASMIGFNYSADASNKPRGAAFSRRIGGADGGLSGIWSGSNAVVVDKLNAYRQWALQGDDS